MDKIQQAKINAMDIFKEVKLIYQKKLNNNFDLDECTKEKLTEIYNRTNEEVLKAALAKYQIKLLKQKEKYEIGTLNVEIIVITKQDFTQNERFYLLSLYIDKLVEYDFESLGLTSVEIIKKQHTSYQDIDKNKIYNTTNRFSTVDNTYSLKLGFSPVKICIKENQHNSKMKVYEQMIDE